MKNQTPEPKNWKDEFREKFLVDSSSVDSSHQFKREVSGRLPELLEAFIENLLATEKRKIVEEIKKKVLSLYPEKDLEDLFKSYEDNN